MMSILMSAHIYNTQVFPYRGCLTRRIIGKNKKIELPKSYNSFSVLSIHSVSKIIYTTTP